MKHKTKPETNSGRLIRLKEVLKLIPISKSIGGPGFARGNTRPR